MVTDAVTEDGRLDEAGVAAAVSERVAWRDWQRE
jgi:hypothetical protein